MKSFLSVIFVLVSMLGFAQIMTDRPTQSFLAYTVPAGKLQIESGFTSERPNSNENIYNVTYLNTLMKFGVAEGFELRITQNYVGERISGTGENGWSPTSLGTKVLLFEEMGNLPRIGILGTYTFTNGTEAFAPTESVSEIRLLFRNTLSDRVSLDYNVGAFWDGSATTGIYAMCFGISATDKLGIFLEPYAFFAKDTPADHRFNTGLTYLVTDNFQLDGSVGNGLVPKAPDYFIAFGASILF